MIHILFIENSVGLGGSTVSLCTLLNYLDPDVVGAHIVLSRPEQATYFLGHTRHPSDLTVITPRPSLKQSEVVRRILDRLGDRKPRLHRLARQTASLADLVVVTLPYAWRLYRWARRRKIQLVHQNNGFDLGSLLLGRMLRVPLVAYQRGDEWNSPAVRWLARGVQHFIANSTTTLKSLTALGIPAGRVSVIYPALDLETLRPRGSATATRATFGVDVASPCFGIVGMLLPWKGHAVFLHAAKRVFERFPKARAFVIGAAPPASKAYEDQVRALAHDLGIADRVIFTGFRPDVPDMLALLDVVVHASIAPEPFGRVIAEAMALRRPVVAAGAGGPTEIIEDGRTGLLFPPGDAHGLADRIIQLLDDPVWAAQIARAGCAAARARFSGETHAGLVQQVYEKVLRPRSGRAALGQRRARVAVPDKLRKGTP